MRLILLGLSFFIVLSIAAQRECATQQYLQTIISSDASLARSIRDAETPTPRSGITGAPSGARLAASTLIRIPVVVHILYNTPSQNIPDAQVQSQIDALNRDFRRRNEDSTKTPERFKSLAADVNIEFALASADIRGKATNGIVRKQTGVSYWTMDDKIKFSAQGGDDAWDSRYYLNIWVGNTRTLLGYASYMGGDAQKDGIVINTTAFGTFNVAAPYNKGRTLVHEAGHWLGLKHIWGDSFCGDDGIEDTPKQGGYTSGNPTGFRTSCNNGASGDMYMNYMDFTNDEALNLFTKGQKDKMRSYFEDGGARQSLLSSRGLNEPWLEAAPLVADTVSEGDASHFKVNVYPNPAQNEVKLNFADDATWVGKKMMIRNLNGVVVQAFIVNAKNQTVNLSNLKPGVYFMQGYNGSKKIDLKLIKL
ncbi:MAG TPA: M43 family zinc metalloprotease [Chitinophagaceae bacterium]|nr:M43 family zinc metalloprotease [Chitinophagaceae bacterium]